MLGTDGPAILIVDDHALFRSGLRLILNSAFDGARIVEAASIEQALGAHAPDRPDVILLDIRLDGLSGLESISLLRRRWPQAPVIMLSSDASSGTIRQARERGAAGFVSKADAAASIIRAIQAALRGEDPGQCPAGTGAGDVKLTARQCEVLHFLGQGLSNKVIARHLGLSENTVRGHVQSLMAQLASSSRCEAAYKARRLGLLA